MEKQAIRILLYDSPDGGAYWIGNGMLLEGDDMYATLLLLEETDECASCDDDSHCVGLEVTVSEWEWNGIEPLIGAERERVESLYKEHVERNRAYICQHSDLPFS